MASPDEETPLMSALLAVDAEELSRELAKNWGLILLVGSINLLCGILALFSPTAATSVAFAFITAALLVGGCFNLLGSCYSQICYQKTAAILGIFQILLGILMATHALESLIVITWWIAVMFMIEGFYRCMLAYKNRDMTGWRSTFFSGVCAILFSLTVILAFPSSSGYTLGILLGVNFVMFGSLRIALGMMGREIANNQIESGAYMAAP
jgi:uncharacterized membrane protein HdeD (DUF308 family)